MNILDRHVKIQFIGASLHASLNLEMGPKVIRLASVNNEMKLDQRKRSTVFCRKKVKKDRSS